MSKDRVARFILHIPGVTFIPESKGFVYHTLFYRGKYYKGERELTDIGVFIDDKMSGRLEDELAPYNRDRRDSYDRQETRRRGLDRRLS